VNTLSEKDQHTAETRPNLVAVGTIVWLSSELMFFAALFAMLFGLSQLKF
jgi:cytochrome c oxidase subunit 3